MVTWIWVTDPPPTVTVAVQELPKPVSVVNPIPVNVPFVKPTPAVGWTSARMLSLGAVLTDNGPPVANILPLLLPCLISLPSPNAVFVAAIPTNCLLEYAVTGLFFLIFPTGSSLLKNETDTGVSVTNFALLSLNLRSSNWLGVQVDWFCDLNSEPRYGCLL